MSDELREQFADLAHAIWAHWMRYMFSCGQQLADDTWIMPADKVKRWTRQMHTPYAELSDKERESDREQADKMIVLFEGAITMLRQRAEAAEKDANELRSDNEMNAHYAARALHAEAERDQLLSHLADADQSSMERIAQIDALEAALAAVPTGAISTVICAAEPHLSDPRHRVALDTIRRWAVQQPEVQP